MATKGSKEYNRRRGGDWVDSEEMAKQFPTNAFIHDWFAYKKLKESNINNKRRRRHAFWVMIWWVFCGILTFISLAAGLATIHENLFPVEDSTTFVDGIIKILFFFYFLFALGTFIYILKIKNDIYKKYQEEVFDFFDRYYRDAERKFYGWEFGLLENFISITEDLIIDPYLENAGVMSHIEELNTHYKELKKELERQEEERLKS